MIMTLLAIPIVIAARPIVHVFDVAPGTPLESYSIEWMRVLGYAMLPGAVNTAYMGMFQGSGATRTSLALNFFTTILVQVPLAAILGFAFDLGALGVWLSFPLSFVLKGAWGYVVYRRAKWAVTGLTPRHPATTPEA